jgi:hypothetical protein
MLAGVFMIDVIEWILKHLYKARALRANFSNENLIEKLGFGYACIVYFISVSLLPFRYGFYGLNITLSILGKIIIPLSLCEVYLLIKRFKHLKRPCNIDLIHIVCISFLVIVFGYIYSIQSINTQCDVLVFDIKQIAWGIHEDTLSDPKLSMFYALQDHAEWLIPVIDNIFNMKDSYFALPILGILSFATLTYSFTKRTFGREIALSSFILFFASPLLLKYSSHSLYRDLEVYLFIFACFYATWRISISKDRTDQYLWSILLGITLASALFSEKKSLLLFLLIFSIMVYFSNRSWLKILWVLLSGVGVLYWVWIRNLADIGELRIAYLDVPLLVTASYMICLLMIYCVTMRRSVSVSILETSKFHYSIKHCILIFMSAFPALFWMCTRGYLYFSIGRWSLLERFGWALPPLPGDIYKLLGWQQQPPLVGIYYSYRENLVNVLYLFIGAYTYPLLIMPVSLIGTFILIHEFLFKRDNNLGVILIYYLVLTFSWVIFMNASVNGDNWRFVIFTVPFFSIAASRTLSFRLHGKSLLYFALLLTAMNICLTMAPYFGLLVTRGNYRQIIDWLNDYRIYTWIRSDVIVLELLMVLLMLSLMYVFEFQVRIRLKVKFIIHSQEITGDTIKKILFVLLFMFIITAPFMNTISSTIFEDIYNVKKPTYYSGWNLGLKDPYDYILSRRSEFNGTFLTLYTNGIEYYANVISIDIQRPELILDFWRYLNDTSMTYEYLVKNNIRYVLIPLPSNVWIGSYSIRLLERTCLRKILANSTIIKLWPSSGGEGGWILFDVFSQAEEPVLGGCVLYYSFDEERGSFVHDSSGCENHGVVNGATWATGLVGNSLSFDGVDDYVEVPYNASLNSPNALTLEMWIRPTVNITTSTTVFLSREYYPYDLQYENGYLQFYLYIGGSWSPVSYRVGLYADEWYHIVGVFDGRYARLYLNGAQVAIRDWGEGSTIQSTTNKLCIGQATPTPGHHSFYGAIDELKIYNRALSPNEIFLHYLRTKYLRE